MVMRFTQSTVKLMQGYLLGVPMYICNQDEFGHMSVPRGPNESLKYDVECFTDLKLDAMSKFTLYFEIFENIWHWNIETQKKSKLSN